MRCQRRPITSAAKTCSTVATGHSSASSRPAPRIRHGFLRIMSSSTAVSITALSSRYDLATVVAPVTDNRSARQALTRAGLITLTCRFPNVGSRWSRNRRRYSSAVVGATPRSTIQRVAYSANRTSPAVGSSQSPRICSAWTWTRNASASRLVSKVSGAGRRVSSVPGYRAW